MAGPVLINFFGSSPRSKGRDLFDLWKAQALNPDWDKVVALFLKYMALAKKPIFRGHLRKNLQEKLSDKEFRTDIEPLILASKEYDIKVAGNFVMEGLFSKVPQSKSQSAKKSGT